MSTITRSQIRERATETSFQRGESYHQDGSVTDFSYQQDKLQARVKGSEAQSYRVEINLIGNAIASATCTCAYDGAGDCKHIVAVLLTFIQAMDGTPAPTSPDDLLKQMSADQLRDVIGKLRDQKPELEDWFRVVLPGFLTPSPAKKPVERPASVPQVDVTAFRRQVKRAIAQLDYGNHWQSIWAVVGALDEMQNQATAYLERGDFNNALSLMRIIGEEVAPQYGEIEEECQLSDFLTGWGEDLAVAVLGADLSEAERQTLADDMEAWLAELSDYGTDEVLMDAIRACEREAGAPLDEALAGAWLDVLAYKGDDAAYLEACLQHEAHYRYVYRLAELGRVDEVVAHVAGHALRSHEYLHLVEFLEAQGHAEAAYQIGASSLSRQDMKSGLATWVAGRAEQRGQLETAQQAWRVAFADEPSVDAYENLKRLSGDDWQGLRPELLARAEGGGRSDVMIKIAIADHDIERAIQLWDANRYGHYELLDQLITAAAETHPDWAAQQAITEARKLIERGSKYYPPAVHWLGKAKAVYMHHNRAEDWKAAVASIRAEHGRKYSLIAQMKTL